MHKSCSNTMPALPPMGCDGKPLAAESRVLYDAPKQETTAKYQMYKERFDLLISKATPEFLATEGARLVCATEEEATYMRLLLDRRDLRHIDTRVAPKLPNKKAFRAARYQAGYKARR